MKSSQAFEKRMKELCQSDVIVAFSGGADSSLLLKAAADAAKETGKKVYAVTVQTSLHTLYDIEFAEKQAKEIGVEQRTIVIDELLEAGIENNPKERCYLCKKYLFLQIKKLGEALGVSVILEGTNEDDLSMYRPGIRAVRELGVISPLAECHMTKDEVRRLAAEKNLVSSKRPAAPCLATRFPYGTKLSKKEMQKAAAGEAFLKNLGFYNVRLRVYGRLVRIEVDETDIEHLFAKRKEITEKLKQTGYTYVTVDLEGFRSGSMDEE